MQLHHFLLIMTIDFRVVFSLHYKRRGIKPSFPTDVELMFVEWSGLLLTLGPPESESESGLRSEFESYRRDHLRSPLTSSNCSS